MAFVKSIQAVTQGFGTGVAYKTEGTALTGTTTIAIPASGSFSPPISRGKWRLKQTVANAATILQLTVTGTDGSTVLVLATCPANAAGALCDLVDEFVTDLNLTSVSFVCTLTGTTTTTTVDVELVGMQ